MNIHWLDDAVSDLQSLRHYITQDNAIAANRLVKKILNSIEMLSKHPDLGRYGRVLNTRELVISGTPYIVPYQVSSNKIEILRVLHCAMQWPEDF